jgi:hypothetical protein
VAFAFAVAVAFAFAFLVFHSRREPAVALAFAVVLLQNHQSVVISTGASRLCLCDAQWRDLQLHLLLLLLFLLSFPPGICCLQARQQTQTTTALYSLLLTLYSLALAPCAGNALAQTCQWVGPPKPMIPNQIDVAQ